MKKTSYAVALVLTGLLLSGCGMFRSEKAWQTARQESPLEIPPGLDTPSASAALVIPPPGANQPTSDGAKAGVGGAAASIVDGFILSDSVDNAYHRVGDALGTGDIGTVQSHDDSAHTYTLSVVAAAQTTAKAGFFGRMFGRGKTDSDGPGAAPHQVIVSVNGSGQNSTEIRAEGQAAAVAKVVDSLKSRLGGKG